jgi:hypothetical protein
MNVRFLLDENISPKVRIAIQRQFPEIDVLRVGDAGTPPLETLDPAILQYLEEAKRILITKNRASMPGHIADHLKSGGKHWGIFRVRPNTTIRQLMQTMTLVHKASEAHEWINESAWIPF